MNAIRFSSRMGPRDLVVPARFVEQYMPGAHGEFVKIYLLLLSAAQEGDSALTPAQIADRLLITENDVLRALRYWQSEGLLEFTLSEDGTVTDLFLLDPPVRESIAPEIALPDSPGTDKKPASRRLSPQHLNAVRQDPVMMQLLFLAEKYLGKTLTASDVSKIFFFYDELKMTPDLIEYLIEYCVTHNHRSMRYIETVATAWAEKGIREVSDAKKESTRYTREYYSVLKALGITNRSPVEEEIAYIDTWTDQYGFDFSIICEACTRTVMKTGQGSFPYADRILSDWKKQNVRTLDDIKKLDQQFQSRREKGVEKARGTVRKDKPQNRFNNFHQRDYNFDEVEKSLLNPRNTAIQENASDTTECTV